MTNALLLGLQLVTDTEVFAVIPRQFFHSPLQRTKCLGEACLCRQLPSFRMQFLVLGQSPCAYFPFLLSFHGRENKGSPKKRVDIRPSRTSSIDHSKEKDNSVNYNSDPENKRNSAKESDENKENLIMNSEIKDDSILYQDEEVLNDSIISGKNRCFRNLIIISCSPKVWIGVYCLNVGVVLLSKFCHL